MTDRRYLLAQNEDNENILHICAKRQISEDLFNMVWENLLDSYNAKDELINMTDMEGNSPLEVAARSDNEHVCKILLEHIKSTKSKDRSYLSALGKAAHEACQAGNLKILKLIIGFGSDNAQKMTPEENGRIFKIRDKNEYSCLHLAALKGNIQLFFTNSFISEKLFFC